MAVATAARQRLCGNGGAGNMDNAAHWVVKRPIFNGHIHVILHTPGRHFMLNRPETYLTFSKIDWTFTYLDLSHYYLLKLKVTKSG